MTKSAARSPKLGRILAKMKKSVLRLFQVDKNQLSDYGYDLSMTAQEGNMRNWYLENMKDDCDLEKCRFSKI